MSIQPQINAHITKGAMVFYSEFKESVPFTQDFIKNKNYDNFNEKMNFNKSILELNTKMKTLTVDFIKNDVEIFSETLMKSKLEYTFINFITDLFYRNKTIIGLYEMEKYKEFVDKDYRYSELRRLIRAEAEKMNQILKEISSTLREKMMRIVDQTFDEITEELNIYVKDSQVNKKLHFVEASGKYDLEVLRSLHSVFSRQGVDESLNVNGFLNLSSWMDENQMRII